MKEVTNASKGLSESGEVVTMTDAQRQAFEGVLTRYHKVTNLTGSADTYLFMQCHYEGGGSIWLGIEPDGYTHS